jgi:hypothetical protein
MTEANPFWPSPISRALLGDPEAQAVGAFLQGRVGRAAPSPLFTDISHICRETGLPFREVKRALDVIREAGVFVVDEGVEIIGIWRPLNPDDPALRIHPAPERLQ